MTSVLLAAVTVACAGRPAGAPTEPPAGMPVVSEVREMVIPWDDAYPNDAVVDSAGRVWFTDRLTHAIGLYDPATDEFRRYPTPTSRTAPYGMAVAADGGIWFAGSRARLVGRVDPATAEITEYSLHGLETGPHLLVWREGELWFTVRDGRSYGRFEPATGHTTVYTLERERPYSIAAAADGLWLSSYGSFRLLQIDPATGAATVHDLAAARYDDGRGDVSPETAADSARAASHRAWPGRAHRVAVDARGGVWATDFNRGRLLRYEPAAGLLRAWESLDTNVEPYGVALMSGGLVVYAERRTDRVVMLHPVLDERIRLQVPTPGGTIRSIAVDTVRGRIWLPLSDTGRLGLIEFQPAR